MSEDTISRQAVIEINRSYHGQMPNEVNHRIWKEINELPSAQPDLSGYSDKLWKKAYERGRAEAQAEIVRCKDCKYNSNTCGNYVNCDIIPQMFGRTVDNFCSRAERRTDG